MLLLNPSNRILADTIGSRIRDTSASRTTGGDEDGDAVRGEVDVRLCDFDDVTYRVRVTKEEPETAMLSMNLPFYAAVREHGAEEELKRSFGDCVTDAEAGESITLRVPLDGTGLPCPRDEFIDRVGMLRATVVGGVFKRYMAAATAADKPDPLKFQMRRDTTVYLVPGDERVVVVFEFDFKERVDQVVAAVFMKEFTESRRRLGGAPPCAFSSNPPAELASFGVTEPTGSLGFVSFALLQSHVSSPEKIDQAAANLQMFRNYLQYHLKCSKSYFHARMRARVRMLLKILNRAKQDPDAGKEKKTMSGKTFKRK